jgi:hypothetical protein
MKDKAPLPSALGLSVTSVAWAGFWMPTPFPSRNLTALHPAANAATMIRSLCVDAEHWQIELGPRRFLKGVFQCSIVRNITEMINI